MSKVLYGRILSMCSLCGAVGNTSSSACPNAPKDTKVEL